MLATPGVSAPTSRVGFVGLEPETKCRGCCPCVSDLARLAASSKIEQLKDYPWVRLAGYMIPPARRLTWTMVARNPSKQLSAIQRAAKPIG
jgi:hypothetical protein